MSFAGAFLVELQLRVPANPSLGMFETALVRLLTFRDSAGRFGLTQGGRGALQEDQQPLQIW